MTHHLDYALQYAERGWAVFPVYGIEGGACACGSPGCGSPGKHPMTPNGCKAATTDGAIIRGWWTDNPNANIGIATGAISGVMVVDVDVGPQKEGLQSLMTLESQYGAILRDYVVRTGSGGMHIYLAAPDRSVKNSASRVGQDIDIRGDGGYVVAPPSLHISGKTYVWETKK